jgi:hypothetical protein
MLGSTHLGSRMLLLMGLDTCPDDPTFSPNWATRVAKKRYSLLFRLHFRTHPSRPCRCATPLWCAAPLRCYRGARLAPGRLHSAASPREAAPTRLPLLPPLQVPLAGGSAATHRVPCHRPLSSFSSTMTAQLSPAMQCFVRPPTKFC